ncbi:histone deacetylase family protein [Robbsia andropogonis]|uniref:histone deacetylase family protein n=1 Tax=Robbsia andropogonis TaxID=28092 RepID=UPI003D257154
MPSAFFSHPDCLRHQTDAGHPECPERLHAIDDQVIAARLDAWWLPQSAPLADRASLLRAHDADYLDRIAACVASLSATPQGPSSAAAGDGARKTSPRSAMDGTFAYLDGDTVVSPGSWQAALRAAGAAVAATDAVLDGRFDNAFCSVRPPGHHATRNQAMGFCLINNVAVAVLHALAERGLQRVAIIDFDVHHGNGTESIFAGDDRVLMCSTFRHPFYPHCGVPGPASNIVNAPLSAGADGAAFRDAVQTHWLPRLQAFAPEMVFVSAGFDAHREDEMGGLALVEADYAWVTEKVRDIAMQYAAGRIVSVLEGGYAFSALGRSVVAHVRAMANL